MLHGVEWLGRQYNQLANPAGGPQSATNTISTLAERLTAATSLEDRRAAVLALKGLSRDHTQQVGEKAFSALLTALQQDTQDEETARALVECCVTLCEVVPPPVPEGAKPKTIPSFGIQNSDAFLSEPGPLHALLPLLSPNRGFYTRFASLQLLGLLLRNRPTRVQDHVLIAPGGCGAILECLGEGAGSSSEIVRNEALLLLPHLVHANADIQKLVAFEGAFEKLLDVVAQEGRVEGGVIVQDALEGLESLLRYNVSNQNYFRETLSIPMLAPLLFYPPPPPPGPNGGFSSRQAEQEHARQLEAFAMQEWDEQKLVNARLVVGIVGLLVGGQGEGRKSNQVGNIALVMSSDAYLARAQVQFLQNAIWQSGLTKCLFELALASTAPPLLKAQALNVLASILKSSRSNQDLLSSLLVCPLIAVETAVAVNATLADGSNGADVPARPSTSTRPSADLSSMQTSERTYTRLPARPAILALIGTAVHGAGADGGLGMRAAALACFEAFVADNLDARLAIISTMVPPPTDNPNDERANERPMSAGSLLLEGLTDFPDAQTRFDPYKHLVAALLFVHLIRGSETAKRMARDIAIGPDGRTVMREPRAADTSGDDDDDDDRASLIQVVVGNLTMAEREQTEAARRDRAAGLAADAGSASGGKNTAMDWTRVMIGYLVCLSTWLWDSPLSVREFLAESANLQVLIQPVAQSSGVDPLVQGLCAFLLGICYEFNTEPRAITRATMHPILHSRIGADQFATRLLRLRDDARFREVGPDVLELAAEEEAAVGTEGAPTGLWFDWPFVAFWKNNFVTIQKTILVDPASSSANQAAASAELVEAERQVAAMRETVSRQAKEIENLERRLTQLTTEREEQKRALTTKLTEAEAAIKEAEPRHAELACKLAAAEEALRSAQAAQADHSSEHATLSTRLSDAETAARTAEAARSETEERASESEKRAKEAEEKCAEITKENEDLLVLLEELSTKRKKDKERMREKGLEVSEDEDEDEDEDGEDGEE